MGRKKGSKLSEEHKAKLKGRTPWNKGKVGIYTEKTRKQMSLMKLGKPTWNKGTKGLVKPNKGSFQKGRQVKPWNKGIKYSIRLRLIIANAQRGEKSHLWKGGVTRKNQIVRDSVEYKIWREAVFKRDDWTCKFCGVRSGVQKKVYLEADHIQEFAYYPELRFAIDNGRTLCKDCHRKRHKKI